MHDVIKSFNVFDTYSDGVIRWSISHQSLMSGKTPEAIKLLPISGL